MLHDELVVGQIFVEGANHPVAIIDKRWVAAVFVENIAFGIGITRDVEPVTAPVFAIMRRCQKAVNDFVVSIRRFIVYKSFDFLGVGGKPCKSKVARRIRVRFVSDFIRREVAFFELGQNEIIQREVIQPPFFTLGGA